MLGSAHRVGDRQRRSRRAALDTKKTAKDRWEEAYNEKDERDVEFSTMSGVPVKPLYTPDDVEGSFEEKIGYPGEYPYTRGVYPNMYRGGCGP